MEINNFSSLEESKKYLIQVLRYRRFRKKFFFNNLAKIYEEHKDLVRNILLKIKRIGNYRNYYIILKHSKNFELNTFVENIIINKIKYDIDRIKNNNRPTAFCKFLPSEKSEINKTTGIVKKICKVIFCDEKNYFSRLKKYRKLKVEFNKYYKNLEQAITTKNFDSINWDDKQNNIRKINKYRKLLIRNTQSERLLKYDIMMSSKMSIGMFVKNYIKTDNFIKLWDSNRTRFLSENIIDDNYSYIFDFSKITYINNNEYKMFGILLLAIQYIDNIFIASVGNLERIDRTKIPNPSNLINNFNIIDLEESRLKYNVKKFLIFTFDENINNKLKNQSYEDRIIILDSNKRKEFTRKSIINYIESFAYLDIKIVYLIIFIIAIIIFKEFF